MESRIKMEGLEQSRVMLVTYCGFNKVVLVGGNESDLNHSGVRYLSVSCFERNGLEKKSCFWTHKQPILLLCFKDFLFWFTLDPLPTYTAKNCSGQSLMCIIRLQGKTRYHNTADVFLIWPPGELQAQTGLWPGGGLAAHGFKTSCSLLFASMSVLVSLPNTPSPARSQTLSHTHENPSFSLLSGMRSKTDVSYKNRTVLSTSVFCCFDECSDVFLQHPVR